MTDTISETLRPFVIDAFRKNAIGSVGLVDEGFDSLGDFLSEPTDTPEVEYTGPAAKGRNARSMLSGFTALVV